MEGSTREPERVDGGEESTPADAREDRERKGLRRKCRSGSESMSQRKIARRAWHGMALRGVVCNTSRRGGQEEKSQGT